MLAAGGTGGHLFPAFALAQELGRRAIAVDLVTDMRGDRYGTNFPARAVYRVPSATLGGPLVPGGGATALDAGARRRRRLQAAGQVKPGAVVGFGGYPAFPPLVAARLRGIPTALHEQNAVLGRANRVLARHVTAIATSFEDTKFLGGRRGARRALTGNPVRDQVVDWATQSYHASGRHGPLLAAGVRRQPGRALLLRYAAAGAGAAARGRSARSLFVVQQCREEDLARVEAAYQAAGVRAHLATFLRQPARGDGKGAPGDRPLRRLHGRRADRDGPAGDTGAAAACHRQRPAAECAPAGRIGGGLVHGAEGPDAGALAKAIAGLLASPEALAQAAAAAKRRAGRMPSLRLADLVEELIGRRPRSA